MWPWEHLAFGYVCYSAYVHLRHGRRPADAPVIAVAAITLFPDLVDKPLAWTVGILPAGRSLTHSLVFAGLVCVAAIVLARRWGVPEVGQAIAIGYGSHLLGDVIYPLAYGSPPNFRFPFWPFVSAPLTDPAGLSAETLRLLTDYVGYLASPTGRLYLAFEVALVIGVFILWVVDGRPGLTVRRAE